MTRSAARFIAYLLVVMLHMACGRQVYSEYIGEPLLSIQGQVKSNALTGSTHALPALCFERFTADSRTSTDKLPENVRELLGNPPSDRSDAIHQNIVDVESHGDFPAEFGIDVYLPPDPSALVALIPGEPRVAFGSVCAVTPEHRDEVQPIAEYGYVECPEEGCHGYNARVNADSSRYYLEKFRCPAGAKAPADCEITPDGDAKLKQESGGYESVIAVNSEIQVIYLAEPAPKGSYAAYRAGAPDGLEAGYHVRSRPRDDDYPFGCLSGELYEAALAELNDKYGTDYEFLSGPSQAGISEQIIALREIIMRRRMQACPLLRATTEHKSTDQLSITLDPEVLFAQPTPYPGWNG